MQSGDMKPMWSGGIGTESVMRSGGTYLLVYADTHPLIHVYDSCGMLHGVQRSCIDYTILACRCVCIPVWCVQLICRSDLLLSNYQQGMGRAWASEQPTVRYMHVKWKVVRMMINDVRQLTGREVVRMMINDVHQLTGREVARMMINDVHQLTGREVARMMINDVHQLTGREVARMMINDVHQLTGREVARMMINDVHQLTGREVARMMINDVHQLTGREVARME